jgi:DNA mismatch repair ATPase MutS
MLGLWEVHVLRRLERWQDDHRDHANGWFESLGELEAVGSISALAAENPNWAWPQWTEANDDAAVEAGQMGHPLLKDAIRVCNDVKMGPSGTLLLVTGSNMSGKSTMLRSVGLNVLLAGAGAPVCAEALSLPSLELATSIRVRDNLGEGVSFYMAELHSLARVVKHAERLAKQPTGGTSKTRLLFLLDEILQGTNSRERQIAVAHVLRHLVKCEAIGAITTHDLELADDPQLKAMAHTVHFRETITVTANGEDTMTFDYRMREGVSPTTNALRLLEVVGLGKPDLAD